MTGRDKTADRDLGSRPTAPNNQPVRLIHISDVHLGPLPPFAWPHWNLKRALGFANWQRKRRHVHSTDALACITEAIKARPSDHILVGGDLINIGLPLEYATALRWLLELGPPTQVAVVPGNHDVYTRLWTDAGVLRWQAFMTGNTDPDHPEPVIAQGLTFPYLRIVGNVAIIGVNTAIPTAPGIATGRIGGEQLDRLERTLNWTRDRGLFRLILMHHPPRPDQSDWRRGLRDGDRLLAMLERTGVDAILHGHNHRPMRGTVKTPTGIAPTLGVGSASAEVAHGDEPLATFHALEISGTQPGNWQISCDRYGLIAPETLDDDVSVHHLERWVLPTGAAETAADAVPVVVG
ncbi:MAG: metallophosphoesterase [Pseudomonadota bacterium]